MNCKRRSNTYDHFQDLILDIRSVDHLTQALELYFKKETLYPNSGYKCVRCKSVVQASKKFSLEKAPNVLIIQLKR
jgi:ubiquitin carboxyl-terminal hydrolase 36/42